MRLKKVKKNISKLFCALFMLGMNVYGVESTSSDDPKSRLRSIATSSRFDEELRKGTFDQALREGDFKLLPELIKKDGVLNQDRVNKVFNRAVWQLLYVEEKNNNPFIIVKHLTSRTCTLNPTAEMWYEACHTVASYAGYGSNKCFDVLKYLTSDACRNKPETLDLDWRMEETQDDLLEYCTKMATDPTHESSDKAFSVLKHLTSKDCKVLPSQDNMDEIFSEKADEFGKRYGQCLTPSIQGFLPPSIEERKSRAEEELEIAEEKRKKLKIIQSVLQHLTSKDCSVPPSEEVVNDWFDELTGEYIRIKSEPIRVYVWELGLPRIENHLASDCLEIIQHLTSDACNRHPSPEMVLKCLNSAKEKKVNDLSEHLSEYIAKYSNNKPKEDRIEP